MYLKLCTLLLSHVHPTLRATKETGKLYITSGPYAGGFEVVRHPYFLVSNQFCVCMLNINLIHYASRYSNNEWALHD